MQTLAARCIILYLTTIVLSLGVKSADSTLVDDSSLRAAVNIIHTITEFNNAAVIMIGRSITVGDRNFFTAIFFLSVRRCDTVLYIREIHPEKLLKQQTSEHFWRTWFFSEHNV